MDTYYYMRLDDQKLVLDDFAEFDCKREEAFAVKRYTLFVVYTRFLY